MAVRWLQQQRTPEAVLSALVQHHGVSRRQAYRYLLQAQSHLELRPVPEPKTVFTVNLPVKLIQAVRVRCRQERQPISHVVGQVLERWLEQSSAHG
jgi:hypothetical protein